MQTLLEPAETLSQLLSIHTLERTILYGKLVLGKSHPYWHHTQGRELNSWLSKMPVETCEKC